MSPLALVDVLAQLPDPRGRQGKFHPLPAVLSLVVLGVLLGRTGISGIARLGRQYGAPLAHALGFRRGTTPAKSTLSQILRLLDAQRLETLLSRWIASRINDVDSVALDGKTLRGSRNGEVPGQHLVAAYAPHVEAVLAQIRVDAKTHEHKAALNLLGVLPLKNKVVIGDAMFCQRDLAKQIIDPRGDDVLIVKENQPELLIDIGAGFAFEKAAKSIAKATGGGKPPRSSETPGEECRQEAPTAGSADVAGDVDSDRAREMAGLEARL